MGLLDDAIREHLELKRRHGADPDEVQRQEREALGASPQRAEFAQPEGEEPGDAEVEAPDGPAPPPEEEPAAAQPPPGEEEDPWLVEDLADPEPEPAPEPEEPGSFAAGDVVAPDEEQPADELEETPDFLQETPEHDRLWFEQKPPRDFDWDK